ncbi:MAG: TonB-dependent receptor plug domain-containing protein [Bacteroidales bacterium]|nr:TonB-dependent receptor plug domain-containing protein [Bacteroidales bacterium]
MKKAFISLSVLLSLSFLSMAALFSQSRVIQGRVTVFDSIPVVNASVVVKSTDFTQLTDSLGFFSVVCNESDIIRISAQGFRNFKTRINPKELTLPVNLKLKKGDVYLEMALDHGHILDKDRLAALAFFKISDISSGEELAFDYSTFTTLEEAIMGRFSGVRVVNGEVIIRGIETWALSNAALVVVDGVVRGYSIAGISPETVGSITFLKGPDAVIYGSRGANGVVLIRTKRGGE